MTVTLDDRTHEWVHIFGGINNEVDGKARLGKHEIKTPGPYRGCKSQTTQGINAEMECNPRRKVIRKPRKKKSRTSAATPCEKVSERIDGRRKSKTKYESKGGGHQPAVKEDTGFLEAPTAYRN